VEVPAFSLPVLMQKAVFLVPAVDNLPMVSCGDLGLHIHRLQTTFPSVTLSKLKGLLPFGAAQANFHGIADELLWSNLLFRRSFLDLLQQLAWKLYILGCHGSILLHFRQPLT
jgi:hypothetical protein